MKKLVSMLYPSRQSTTTRQLSSKCLQILPSQFFVTQILAELSSSSSFYWLFKHYHRYFVIANAVASVYGLLVLFLPSKSLLWRLVIVLDVVIVYKACLIPAFALGNLISHWGTTKMALKHNKYLRNSGNYWSKCVFTPAFCIFIYILKEIKPDGFSSGISSCFNRYEKADKSNICCEQKWSWILNIALLFHSTSNALFNLTQHYLRTS